MQTLPQRPQLFESSAGFTQVVPHINKGEVQVPSSQKPERQVTVPGHTRSHAPQLKRSTRRLVQNPPQRDVPAVHEGTQLPVSHSWPAGHTRPQPPQ